jgi:hypothetical protein
MWLVAGAVLSVAAGTASAQKTTDLGTGNGGSAHVRSEWTVNGAHLAVTYGRPALKGRPEATLMPPGKVWRTGADQATVLTTDKALVFGDLVLQPGSYTINTEPGARGWQLIFGKLAKDGQWGIPYQPQLEIGRVPMAVGKLVKPVEQLTITIDDLGARQALRVDWGTTSASAQFRIRK